MSKPRLLDLFCGAGGAGMGYSEAGFEVVGMDIEPQKHYPFPFRQMDALKCMELLIKGGPVNFFLENAQCSRQVTVFLDSIDVIHASPPCQGYSCVKVMHTTRHKTYPMLIEPVRKSLRDSDLPYVIENVPGCPLIDPITLCGVMFDLKVFRHRLFESNVQLQALAHIPHGDRRIGKGGFCCVAGHGDSGRDRVPKNHRTADCMRAAMGIDWMTRSEITQAIPPAYTVYIGKQLIEQLKKAGPR